MNATGWSPLATHYFQFISCRRASCGASACSCRRRQPRQSKGQNNRRGNSTGVSQAAPVCMLVANNGLAATSRRPASRTMMMMMMVVELAHDKVFRSNISKLLATFPSTHFPIEHRILRPARPILKAAAV